MPQPGPRNLITDVDGITVGNATDETVKTGVTVLRCAESFTAAADTRGGGPASRDVDVLQPENLVGKADAIVLSGGSVFGLAAADGVSHHLSAQNIGLHLAAGTPAVPITPAASLYDLANDGDKNWGAEAPYRALGVEACNAASADFDLGSHGAGRGAMAGSVKGGLGSASITLDNGVTIGALVAVNPVGSVYMADGESFYAWPWEQDNEFGGRTPPTIRDSIDPYPPHSRLAPINPRANTTLAIIACSADLSCAEAKRVAMMAHDGIARAIRPAHTLFDGDIAFCIATAKTTLPDDQMRPFAVSAIGASAGDCLARAIARGAYHASLP